MDVEAERRRRIRDTCRMSIIARRNWALRLSIVLNICVLLYVCAHLTSSGPWIEDGPNSWNVANAVPLAETYGSAAENGPVNASQRTREPGPSAGQQRLPATKETSGRKEKPIGEDVNNRQKQEIVTSRRSGQTKTQTSMKSTAKEEQLYVDSRNSQEKAASENNDRGNNTVRNGQAARRKNNSNNVYTSYI